MITLYPPAKTAAQTTAKAQPAMPGAQLPEGILPLNARGQSSADPAYWGLSSQPANALRPPAHHAADPTSMVRSVTGAVVAVSAAMRNLSAALEGEAHDPAAVDRAMAALNAAVADQAMTARRVLHRFEDYQPL